MKKLLMLLVVLSLLGGYACAEGEVTLHAVNVGKADALILQSGESVYLIDAGTEESWPKLSLALHSQGIDRLTGVIITHTDEDHGGGAAALAQSSIQVDAWYASVWYTCKEKKHPAILAAKQRGQEVVWLEEGMTLPLDGATMTVLGPVEEDPDKENNNSAVLLVEGGGCRMLLAGDMEFPEEKSLLARKLIPQCDVLKVGNHGESDATSDGLVQAVKPKIAVISTNTKEEPDTPASRVLKVLKKVNAAVYETQDSDAGVLVTLSGGKATAANVKYNPLPEEARGVEILDKGNDDSVVLINNGTEVVDMTDWFIYSERGGQTFVFPKGAVIQPGQRVTVVSESSKGEGDYVWPDTKVWHKSKEDKAILYDQYGRTMDHIE